MTVDTGQLRTRLRNIDTRAAAIDAVAERGAEAAEAVLPLLGDRHEGVRWSAIRILAESTMSLARHGAAIGTEGV